MGKLANRQVMFNYTSSHVYLLRSWHEDGQLRLRLENPHSGEHHTFDHIDTLNAFLAQTFGADEQTPIKHGDKKDDC